ncbi:Digeranylgeranylglyceryl phosphate synthase [Naviculisporaceae sp. PSN 640]
MPLSDSEMIQRRIAGRYETGGVASTWTVCTVLRSGLAGLGIIWGFVSSDFLTFAVPNTLFGLVGALPGTGLTQADLSSDTSRTNAAVFYQAPKVLLFNFYSLLLFDLSNQHWPESVREDAVNKPWRPIPSGRITPRQTQRLVMVLAPIALGLNYMLGVWSQGLLVQVLSWYYNDLRGCDEVFRDAIIAVSYGLANLTSLWLAASSPNASSPDQTTTVAITPRGYLWTAMISGVILTTMHVQDLKDQEGDKSRNRKTVPLVFGDWFSRWAVAAFVPFWSVMCAAFWHDPLESALGVNNPYQEGSRSRALLYAGHWMYIVQLILGLLVAQRVLSKKSPREDANTWRLWCFWHSSLYALPLVSRSK